MAVDFFLPKLGDGVDEATIVNWLVEDGAKVEAGDEILEVETDKAVVPIPANGDGHVHIGPYKAGDVIPISTVVATIGAKDEDFAPGSGEATSAEDTRPEERPSDEAVTRTETQPEAVSADEDVGTDAAEQAIPSEVSTLPKASPVAQKMAADMEVDLRTVSGSGDHGKITKDDVRRAATSVQTPEPAPPAQPAATSPAGVEPAPEPAAKATPAEDVLERIPLKGVRGVIARRMPESVHTTARVTLVTEVDATEFVTLRERLKAKFTDAWGFAPGYNDLLALIVANALREFPYMNARMSAEGDAIEYVKPINIGMAVDTDRGLMVPVVKDANTKGLQQFGTEFRELVERARVGKSSLDDLSGGTFTITSLGIYRVEAFTPIINLPEAAVLGVGRITPKPVVKDGEIVIRKMVTLSLVFDHRLTDGAPAARFLDHICEMIEEPSLLFLTSR
jgi:pyruvate dehydrogenase E2 component (dihydrolipoamide acetyltransferase)